VSRVLECEGAPRDLGRDQGVAWRETLRRRCATGPLALLRALIGPGASTARTLRDVRRHFPQQSEQLEGIARGARLFDASVARAMVATLRRSGGGLAVVQREGAPLVAALLPNAVVLRRSRPEGRFGAIEATLPELTTALLAVNDRGLAVAVSPGPAAREGECAAPAALLLRDCIERFDAVGPALEWCRSRPAAPGGALVFADAAGGAAGLEFAAERRVLRRPRGGVLLLGQRVVPAEEAAKRLAELAASEGDPEGLHRVFGSVGVPACADPATRRLWLDGRWWANREPGT
jgi:hypothetical protein